MIRFVVGCEHCPHVSYVVADEVSGATEVLSFHEPVSLDADDGTWPLLEDALAQRTREELAAVPGHYRGLRATTVLGSWRTTEDKLQLRSGADTMTLDVDMAMAFRRALNDYLDSEPTEATVVDFTPYRASMILDGKGAEVTVSLGRFSRSQPVDQNLADKLVSNKTTRASLINRMLTDLKDSMAAPVG